jgi:hypothetical protein
MCSYSGRILYKCWQFFADNIFLRAQNVFFTGKSFADRGDRQSLTKVKEVGTKSMLNLTSTG